MTIIRSLQNERVKGCVKLRERRCRDRSGQFLIEGYRELTRAIQAGKVIEILFICPALFLGENERVLIDKMEEDAVDVVECSVDVFRKMSYRDRPDGLLAVAPQMTGTVDDISFSGTPFCVVAEAIEKPGNLGTILRSSDAVAVDGVIVCDRCTDIHNPNVVRASVGTLFTLPVVEASSEETIEWLHFIGMQIVAATPSAEQFYHQVDMTGPIAIVVGTEQLGLSKQWLDSADISVQIPMLGVADSLNVATATTILLYEVIRQRGYSLS